MAIKRLAKDGYGQIELNQVAFRRDGRIEAQCALDAVDFASILAENGMLLAVNNITRTLHLPVAEEEMPIALNYSAEHMYDERLPGLKNFALSRDSFLPRLGYLAEGDKFTTNTVCYDDGEFADDDAMFEALAAGKLYGGISTDGYIKVSATKPAAGPALLVIQKTTMPDGQAALKFQALK